MSGMLLAGTLEKRTHWRREWTSRFFVLRPDRLDYYLTPPAIVDDENAEELRGSIALTTAEVSWEPERQHCLRLGTELLSCATQAEQQRWLDTLNAAAADIAARQQSSRFYRRGSEDEAADQPGLLLLQPDGPPKVLRWREPVSVSLAHEGERATVLLVEDGGAESAAQAFCQLDLYASESGGASARVQRISGLRSEARGHGGDEDWRLVLEVQGNQLCKGAPSQRGLPDAQAALACVAAAVALLVGSSVVAGLLVLVLALLLLRVGAGGSPSPARRCVTFSADRLVRGSPAQALPRQEPEAQLEGGEARWKGRWVLDKSCSERYEPILQDMGVNFLVRKAADAKTSVLTISLSSTHVTINVQTLVTVEDCLALDGSWVTKPVPPAGRMRGEMCVRLRKATATELTIHTKFPEGEGELLDELVVSEDGRSFTRVVTRGSLTCTRVFRLDAPR